MIPNQWYPVLRVEDLRSDKPTEARRVGKNIIVWRGLDGRLVCQDARCPHKGAHLGDGRLKGDTVECAYHGFRFGMDGGCVAVPAVGSKGRIPKSLRLQNYPVRERSGLIWMWWGDEREDADLPEVDVPPEVADLPMLYETESWTQPVHYTRYIESLLEFYHIPWVHRDHWFNYLDYVGLSGTLRNLGLDGPERYVAATMVDNRRLSVDGTTLRASFDQVEEGNPANFTHFEVVFSYPCMVHIVSNQFETTIWMPPIDEENTQVFFRWYESRSLKPVLRSETLRRFLPKAALFMQKRVQERQDMRMVYRQDPKISGRGINKFIAPDELNAKYLAIREKLIRGTVDADESEANASGKADVSDSGAGRRAPVSNGRRTNSSDGVIGSVPTSEEVEKGSESREEVLP